MNRKFLIGSAFFAALVMPLAAHAEGGIPGGAAHGYYEGGRIAGPVGAVVGTAVGGVIGGVEGVLGIPPGYAYAGPAPAPVHIRHVRHHRRHHRY